MVCAGDSIGLSGGSDCTGGSTGLTGGRALLRRVGGRAGASVECLGFLKVINQYLRLIRAITDVSIGK